MVDWQNVNFKWSAKKWSNLKNVNWKWKKIGKGQQKMIKVEQAIKNYL